MKKLIALIFVLTCVLVLSSCNSEHSAISTDDTLETSISRDDTPETLGNNTEWIDGIAFTELEPKAEAKKSDEIIIAKDNSNFVYTITYGRTGLILEVKLIATNGVEYSDEIKGGCGNGCFENLPAGTYRLVICNSGNYQASIVACNATGVINYKIE